MKIPTSRFLQSLVCACCLIVLCSGKYSRHSVWIVVNNTNQDGKAVDMRFTVLAQNQEKSVLAEQSVNTGLQIFPEKKLKEGPYQFIVNTDSEQVAASQAFTVDSDRWILVSYIRQDSTSIMKTYGYIDPARFKKVNGHYATVYISVESRKPAGL